MIKTCGSLFALPARLNVRVATYLRAECHQSSQWCASRNHTDVFSPSPKKSKQLVLRPNMNESKTQSYPTRLMEWNSPALFQAPGSIANLHSQVPPAQALPCTHGSASLNKSLFHCHLHTKQSQMRACFLLLFSTLFFRPHCYEKYQLLKSHFPQKISESCLITSLPPYFFKTVLPASRTHRKHKEKVLCKWGMFLGNACKALPRSHIIILLYFFCCCWSVFKGLDLPCSSNSNLKNIPSSNRDALGCTWDVLGIPALSRYSTAKPCREEVKLPCSPHKKATLL